MVFVNYFHGILHEKEIELIIFPKSSKARISLYQFNLDQFL